MLRAVSLSIRADISSCPLALVGSREHKSSQTASSLHISLSGHSWGTTSGRLATFNPERVIEAVCDCDMQKASLFWISSCYNVSTGQSWNGILFRCQRLHYFPEFPLVVGVYRLVKNLLLSSVTTLFLTCLNFK